MIEIKDVKQRFMSVLIDVINGGQNITGVEAERIEGDTYLIHALVASGDSVVSIGEYHPGRTAEQIEQHYAGEIAAYLDFKEAACKCWNCARCR